MRRLPKSHMPILILGETDIGERVVEMSADLRSPGYEDGLRFTVLDHDPLPLSWEGGLQYVRASWDSGKNWLDGKAKVVDWRADNSGQHITVEGSFMRLEGRDPDNPRRPNPNP